MLSGEVSAFPDSFMGKERELGGMDYCCDVPGETFGAI